MNLNVAQKLIQSHLLHGDMKPGEEIGIRIDQTLTQDATDTLVMLELEAMGLDQVKIEVNVQYVDHNIIQKDFKNPDDHLFLRSACQRFGVWYSRPGNGVSHPCHQENFGKPGKTLLGSDTNVSELVQAIDEYVAHHNTNPKPFIWTKSARDILQKVIRANRRLSSKQNEALH